MVNLDDALATAWLQFTALADELPACPHKNALRLAAEITDSMMNLRAAVQGAIIDQEASDNFTAVDMARELRRALAESIPGRPG
jgi:hypothetical protein